MRKIICFRIAWMKEYQGVKKYDIPKGAGSYVTAYKDGGEVCNFLKISNKYYGYVRVQNNRDIAIERLGANISDMSIDNILVVLFARNPNVGGQYVVGWYNDAKLFRTIQSLSRDSRLKHPDYFCISNANKTKLIKLTERIFQIPDDGPGQSNIWYVNEYHDKKYINELLKYIKDSESHFKKTKTGHKKRNSNFALKQRIEREAMEVTEEYYVNRGFKVEYVFKDKLG